jgi:hypothetical protein
LTSAGTSAGKELADTAGKADTVDEMISEDIGFAAGVSSAAQQ